MNALAQAVMPLSAPPVSPAWNHAEITGVLGTTRRRPAAVLLGFREGTDSHLILTVRNGHLHAHAGQVAFPGGRSEPDDAGALATALRESREEVGLDPALVTPLGYLDCLETISGYCVTPVVGIVAAQARLHPSPSEVAEVFEVPLGFFLDPSNQQRRTVEYHGYRRDMLEFVHDGHRIWGATAAILLNLLKRMGHA